MTEYIEREVLLSAITVDGFEHFSGYLSLSEVRLIEMLRNTVSEIPAADVEVVKHGRWEHDSVGFDDFWRCTFCREDWFFDYDPTKESTRVNYCPNCGCKMDLEVTNGLDQH